MRGYVRRFSTIQRVEHILIMVLFIVLAITGLPQKFFEAGWAQWLILHLGGIDRVRWFHRLSGILFAIVATEHLVAVLFLAAVKRIEFSMVPTRKDFRDTIVMLKYYLGLAEKQAEFDRYDYRQKYEYWGLVFGGVIMILTGFILYLPSFFARFFPGEVIPAAKMAHSNEGLLAFLVVIVYHIYNAHLNPDVFPFDATIFTGWMSEERMEKEHSLEYARLVAKEATPAAQEEAAENPVKEKEADEPP